MNYVTKRKIYSMNRSMRIALINPPLSFSQVYGDWDLSAVDTYCPPLGLLYIAGYVRKYGHKPFIIDVAAKKWTINKTIDYVAALNPDIVGISAKTVDIFSANEISIKLKKNGVRAPIIIGGAHITAVPHETLERFESIDIGVIREGELTFLELIEKIWLKKNLKDIRGIVFRDDNRKIIQTPARPLISDLDILPFPAWDLLDEFPHGYKHNALDTKRLPAASIMTSMGCPFKCTFCDRAVFGSQVRHHSTEYTISMIKMLIKNYNIKDIMILDDNFILSKKKLFSICDSIISENLDISWFCMGHAKVMDQTRLNKIKGAGCWIIELGIESGCDRILKMVQKNTTKAEIAQAVKRAHNAGLKVKGNFIFGLPG